MRGRNPSITDLQDQLDRRTRELSEAMARQASTADVLKVISSSAFDLQAVFEAVVESSARLETNATGQIDSVDPVPLLVVLVPRSQGLHS
jgi:hypothetical protein